MYDSSSKYLFKRASLYISTVTTCLKLPVRSDAGCSGLRHNLATLDNMSPDGASSRPLRRE